VSYERIDAGSERYRTRSSAGGFEPIAEEMTASDPYIARAQAADHRARPPSEAGSQVSPSNSSFIPSPSDIHCLSLVL